MSEVSTEMSYALPKEMYEFQREDRYLFFDPVNFVWFQTDRLGKGVIDGLKLAGSIRNAALEVASLAGASPEEARQYTRQAVDSLVQLGFVHQGDYRRRELSSGLVDHPLILYLHMTSRCNLRCPYCYNQHNRFRLWRASVGSYEQFARVIDEAAALGFQEVKLTGGEPLLNKDTLPLGKYARERGLQVNLMTNGTLVNAGNAARIVEVAQAVSLSLDSPEPSA